VKLFSHLKSVAKILELHEGYWAVCGGIAACLYRETPRYTGDIDIAICDSPTVAAVSIAEQAVQSIGYKPIAGWVTDQHGRLIEGQALVLGRESGELGYIGIDFLLPKLPWIPDAIKRAQMNKLDFGFSLLPTIVPEDLIIAKLFAIQGSPNRPNDLDDVRSILSNQKGLDMILIAELAQKYNLTETAIRVGLGSF
jgi:hypothetical protein